MTDPHEITQQTVHDAFLAAYRRRVGLGTGKISLSDLQDATGIEARTLRSWRETNAMPHLANLLKLCGHFGPDFTSEILHPIDQGGVEYITQQSSDAHRCMADIAGTLNDLAERLRDGVFCHRDKAAIGPELVSLAHSLEEQGRAMIDELPK